LKVYDLKKHKNDAAHPAQLYNPFKLGTISIGGTNSIGANFVTDHGA